MSSSTRPAISRPLSRPLGHPLAQIAIFLLALLAALAAHRSTFQSPWVVNNDATQHTFWMHRFQQPELFSNDLLALYSENYQPWGWRALYRGTDAVATAALGPGVISPVDVGRALGPLLWALSVLLVLRVMGRVAGTRAALLAALLMALSPFFLQKMAGGHPRAFALPILLFTVELLLAHRHRALAVVLPISSLFYPMAFLLAAATTALCLPRWPPGFASASATTRRGPLGWLYRLGSLRWSRGLTTSAALAVLVGITVGGALLALRHHATWAPEIGPMVSAQEAAANPAWTRLGRADHLPTPNLVAVTWESLGRSLPDPRHALWSDARGPLPPIPLALACGALALAAWGIGVRRLRWARPLTALAIASYGLYLASWLLFPALFLPRRYVMYSVPLLAVCALAVLVSAVLESLRPRLSRLATTALILALLSTASGLDGVGLDDYGEHRDLYRFAASLPADTLLAPFPIIADGIPLFARRSVWMTYEHSNPYFRTYWSTVQERLGALFAATYSADEATAAAFCRDHGIDVLVVWRPAFDAERIASRRGAYFEPFSSEIRRLATSAAASTRQRIVPGETFALDRIAPHRRIWTAGDGESFAVTCQELQGGDTAQDTPRGATQGITPQTQQRSRARSIPSALFGPLVL